MASLAEQFAKRVDSLPNDLKKQVLVDMFSYVCAEVVSTACMKDAIARLKEDDDGAFEELQAWFADELGSE